MPILTSLEKLDLKNAIAKAELGSSAEIRACIEKRCSIDPIHRAAFFFDKLGMKKTIHRNGILIYVAYEDKKFAIIGDAGINRHTGPTFWEDVKEEMKLLFADGKISEAMIKGIERAGVKVKHFFPAKKNDTNELPDDVVEID